MNEPSSDLAAALADRDRLERELGTVGSPGPWPVRVS